MNYDIINVTETEKIREGGRVVKLMMLILYGKAFKSILNKQINMPMK